MSIKNEDKITSVSINGKNINIKYVIQYSPQKDGKVFVTVPAFKINFVAQSMDEMKPKAKAMVNMFVKFHQGANKNYNNFLLELHGLGFKALGNHFLEMNKVLTRKKSVIQMRTDIDRVKPGYKSTVDRQKSVAA